MTIKPHQKIRKAVIPAAGFGTRFLPQTKAMPKEMLPIVDKPIIQYVVEECVASGIEDIVMVTNWQKRSIEDHFDYPYELEKRLIDWGKIKELDEIRKIGNLANFIYVRQKGPLGNATAVLCAEPAIENEPFIVIWGDEFIYATPPRLKQMIDVWEKYGGMVISGVRITNKPDVSRYGIADIEPMNEEKNLFKIKKIVEKPKPEEAPSNLATHGAYILPPEIFKAIRSLKPGKGGEVWLVDAINVLHQQGIPLYACEIQNGKYYDTGNKLEYLKTVVEFALKNPDINGEFRKYLKNLKI
jgi:UTP--glucose-1-phosphate uridylyltransferase